MLVHRDCMPVTSFSFLLNSYNCLEMRQCQFDVTMHFRYDASVLLVTLHVLGHCTSFSSSVFTSWFYSDFYTYVTFQHAVWKQRIFFCYGTARRSLQYVKQVWLGFQAALRAESTWIVRCLDFWYLL